MEPRGLPNLGATCWLNTVIQCLRVTKDWTLESPKEGDQFSSDFIKLMKCDTDNTTSFLSQLPVNPFGNGPNDSQEALLYILDRLNIQEFVGEVTQTVIYPGGRSVSKNPCTIWFNQNQDKDDVLSGYEDCTGKRHNVAVINRQLTRVPEILVSDKISDELFGKKICAIVHWGGGHYVSYVYTNGDWWCISDSLVTKATPVMKGYIAFYK